MKRLAALIAAVVLLSACAGEPPQVVTIPEVQPPAAPYPPEDRAATEIVFAISRDASDILVSAAKYFAEELGVRTNGAITVRVEPAIAPDADLLAGRAQIALLNKRRQLAFCEPLSATATSFLYNSYQNFLMRANAANTMNIVGFSLRENHGLVPLGAFYQGALHLLIDFSPGGYHHFEGVSVITAEDAGTRASFERLIGPDGRIIYHDTDWERLERFIHGEGNAVEVSIGALKENLESLPYSVHLIASYHNLVPVWLVADAAFMDELSPRARAEIAELQAYMANMINDAYRELDNQFFGRLSAVQDIPVVFEFTNVRNWVFHTLPLPGSEASDQQRLAIDLIQIMRRTA